MELTGPPHLLTREVSVTVDVPGFLNNIVIFNTFWPTFKDPKLFLIYIEVGFFFCFVCTLLVFLLHPECVVYFCRT